MLRTCIALIWLWVTSTACGSTPKPASGASATAKEPAPPSKVERCGELFEHITALLLERAQPESKADIQKASETQRPAFVDACDKDSSEEEITCGLQAKIFEDLGKCMDSETMAADPECPRPEFGGPVVLAPEAAAQRHGSAVSRFSALQSSMEHPAEVCAVTGSIALLRRLECDDGSKAFLSDEQAYASRSGSVGPGGRCHSVLDLYKVACPGASYDVYIDMYQCLDGEWPE